MNRPQQEIGEIIGLLPGFRTESANRLFYIFGQPGSTLFGGEKPDQNPSDQDEHRHEFQKSRYLVVGLEVRNTGAIGPIATVKKTDNPEKRAVKEINPFRKRSVHNIEDNRMQQRTESS